MQIKKAVILAGGFGTRFLPATISVAKEMFPIVDMPILFYHLKECVDSGITECLIISSKGKSCVKDFLNAPQKLIERLSKTGKKEYLAQYYEVINKLKIDIIYQTKQTGSGSALYEAKKWVNGEDFILFNGDDLFNCDVPAAKQLVDVYKITNKSACMAQQVSKQEISKYGCARLGKKYQTHIEALEIVEKPTVENAPSTFAVVGRYLLKNEIFSNLENISMRNGEYYASDAINMLAKQGNCVIVPVKGEYCDCGNKLEYAKTIVKFILKRPDLGQDFAVFLKKIAKDL